MNVENTGLCGKPRHCFAGFGRGLKSFMSLTGAELFLVLLLLGSLAGGCMTEQAQSDQQWKRYNPNWERPGPAEPYQWGVPFWKP